MKTPTRTLSCKLPKTLDNALTALARQRGVSRSVIVCEALEAFITEKTRRVLLEQVGDLAGSLEGPGNLSTNPKYIRNYGRDRGPSTQ